MYDEINNAGSPAVALFLIGTICVLLMIFSFTI